MSSAPAAVAAAAPPPATRTSPALLTDRYELTMLCSALADGTAHLPAAFTCFARRLPDGHHYGQLAGLGRFLAQLEHFTFGEHDIDWLHDVGAADDAAAEFLRGWRFTGDVEAYPEGELYVPGSPVVVVRGTFADAVLIETLLLSVLNHDTAVMSTAARIVDAAAGASVIELGSRRTHEQAAVAAARACWLAGFDGTSNLAAGRAFGVPTVGTAAHAWTLAHGAGDPLAGERAGFDAQIATLGVGTALLIDTYDIEQGTRRAVAAARAAGAVGPGAVRIDSGDLAVESARVRRVLDELGATTTRIVVSGDLDEHSIARLVQLEAPIDAYGVGTRAVTNLTPPGFVYKLTEIDGAPVSKRSAGKASPHGVRRAWREHDHDGYAVSELLTAPDAPAPTEGLTSLREPVVRAGRVLPRPDLAQVRAHALAARATLRPVDRCATVPGLAFRVADLTDHQAAQVATAPELAGDFDRAVVPQ